MLTKSAHYLTTLSGPSIRLTSHLVTLYHSLQFRTMLGMHTEDDMQRVLDAVDAAYHTHIDIEDRKRGLDGAADEVDEKDAQWKAQLGIISQFNERQDTIGEQQITNERQQIRIDELENEIQCINKLDEEKTQRNAQLEEEKTQDQDIINKQLRQIAELRKFVQEDTSQHDGSQIDVRDTPEFVKNAHDTELKTHTEKFHVPIDAHKAEVEAETRLV